MTVEGPPPLTEIAAAAGRRAPSQATIAALTTSLAEALGDDRISIMEAVRRAASMDYAHMSPLLTAALPSRPADIVVRPRTASELATAVHLACAHDVPIVARGRGTGNYGQAVPLAGGLVLDVTGLDQVITVGDGWIRAQAGATFVALEAAAGRHGQEMAMLPTTSGSTLGGFLAGGAGGIGSIEHGWLWDGFVLALEVVTGRSGTGMTSVNGGLCLPYLHAYGVTGIIAEATVRLAPARDRVALLASFPADAAGDATAAGSALLREDPPPRLVSLDDPALVATYPPDEAMPGGRFSLRAVVDAGSVAAARRHVTDRGGIVHTVSAGAVGYLTTLSFNHVTLRARRSRPELCHLQVGGAALLTNPDQVRAALPGAMLHLDGLRTHLDPADPRRGRAFGGLLLSEYRDPQTLYAGIARLRELGVHVVDPHTWLLGGPALAQLRATAAANDPRGLLNPGKLPPD